MKKYHRKPTWNEHATSLTIEHLNRAGVPVPQKLMDDPSWHTLGRHVSMLVNDHRGAPWTRDLIHELVQHRLKHHEGNAKVSLAEFLEILIRYETWDRREYIEKLLPPEAGPALALLKVWEDEALRRLNESGY